MCSTNVRFVYTSTIEAAYHDNSCVDADESWGTIGSLSVMVAALPAQEELFCFHSCAQARPLRPCGRAISTRTFAKGTPSPC